MRPSICVVLATIAVCLGSVARAESRIVARLDMAVPATEPFLLRATIPVEKGVFPRADGRSPFSVRFPGKPYPGHDVDEKAPVADLRRGYDVLLVALRDLATSPPLVEPFKP